MRLVFYYGKHLKKFPTKKAYHKLENQRQRSIRVNNVVQSDHIGVSQIAQQRYLPNGRAGGPLFLFQPNLLQGHQSPGELRSAPVNGGIGALTELFQALVGFQLAEADFVLENVHVSKDNIVELERFEWEPIFGSWNTFKTHVEAFKLKSENSH